MTLIECVVNKANDFERSLDVSVCRGAGEGMSDHFLVGARLKSAGGCRSTKRMEGVGNVLKVSELNKSVKEQACQYSFGGKD